MHVITLYIIYYRSQRSKDVQQVYYHENTDILLSTLVINCISYWSKIDGFGITLKPRILINCVVLFFLQLEHSVGYITILEMTMYRTSK